MLKNIALQSISFDDCEIKPINDISSNLVISGKNYYAPKFENPEIKNIELYFRVKYKKTKAAVSRDKIPFQELVETSGFLYEGKVNLVNIIDHAKCIHIDSCGNTNKYIVYFITGDPDDLTQGYLVFNYPVIKDKSKLDFTKYELKAIKYFKKLLDI